MDANVVLSLHHLFKNGYGINLILIFLKSTTTSLATFKRRWLLHCLLSISDLPHICRVVLKPVAGLKSCTDNHGWTGWRVKVKGQSFSAGATDHRFKHIAAATQNVVCLSVVSNLGGSGGVCLHLPSRWQIDDGIKSEGERQITVHLSSEKD